MRGDGGSGGTEYPQRRVYVSVHTQVYVLFLSTAAATVNARARAPTF